MVYKLSIRGTMYYANEKALKYISNKYNGLDRSFIDVVEEDVDVDIEGVGYNAGRLFKKVGSGKSKDRENKSCRKNRECNGWAKI